jgi:hypothetical protein
MPSRSDKLFQKRRSLKKYPRSRKAAFRKPRDRVLIACEGSKTEPQYFEHLVSKNPSASVAIQVHGEECGSDPVSVVEHGYLIAKQEGHYTNGGYRHVCIALSMVITSSGFELLMKKPWALPVGDKSRLNRFSWCVLCHVSRCGTFSILVTTARQF